MNNSNKTHKAHSTYMAQPVAIVEKNHYQSLHRDKIRKIYKTLNQDATLLNCIDQKYPRKWCVHQKCKLRPRTGLYHVRKIKVMDRISNFVGEVRTILDSELNSNLLSKNAAR